MIEPILLYLSPLTLEFKRLARLATLRRYDVPLLAQYG